VLGERVGRAQLDQPRLGLPVRQVNRILLRRSRVSFRRAPLARDTRVAKKKGPLASQRPKSREETPKEGGGNVREDDAALHQYAPAPHKKQVSLTYPSHGC